jgi:hypothetical protein
VPQGHGLPGAEERRDRARDVERRAAGEIDDFESYSQDRFENPAEVQKTFSKG